MRFMMFIKSDPESESGALPSPEIIAAMDRYNEELNKAGVLLQGEGLHPTSKGVRLSGRDGKLTITDGPFAEAKELIAGFWMIQVRSKEEAVEWAKRIPNMDGTFAPQDVELRQVFDFEDFPEELIEQAPFEKAQREKSKK